MDIVEVFRIVCCSACAQELVAGLLRPRLFPFGKLSKLKSAAHLINMNVHHSATCSCSIELYKQQWYTSVDFLPGCDISLGFLYVCLIYIAGRISAAVCIHQQGAAQLRRMQCTSEGCGIARSVHSSSGAQPSSDRMQHIAQKGAAQLRRMQLDSEGAAQLTLGAVQLS